MTSWLIRLQPDRLNSIGPYRHQPWLAIHHGDHCWLRGAYDEQGSWPDAVLALPFDARFELQDDGNYRLPGQQLYAGHIKMNGWQELSALVPVTLPNTRHPPPLSIGSDLCLRTMPQATQHAATHAVLPLQAWNRWANRALSIRLHVLTWTLLREDLALVTGNPLPALPGIWYQSHDGLLMPLAKRWDPPIAATILRQWLGLKQGDSALWEDGIWSIIPADSWAPAARAAIQAAATSMCSGETAHEA